MADMRWRCKHCWAEEDQITDYVKTEGWASVNGIRREADAQGKEVLHFRQGRVEHDMDHDHQEFRCENCEKVAYLLEDLVEQYDASPTYACRACGWEGSDLDEHVCAEEPEATKPTAPDLPGQETLDVAG